MPLPHLVHLFETHSLNHFGLILLPAKRLGFDSLHPLHATLRRCFQRVTPLVTTNNPITAQTRLILLLNELFLALLEMLRSHKPKLDANLSSSARTVELFLPANIRGADRILPVQEHCVGEIRRREEMVGGRVVQRNSSFLLPTQFSSGSSI